jgi:hypothetical protein
MGNYHMTTFKQAYISIDPRVYPHAGTAVEPPDAQVPGVSPVREGLGMDEQSAADRAIRLSNRVKTAPPRAVDLPTLLHHAPYNPPQTFCRDTNVIEWFTYRDLAPAYAAHLLTSTRSDQELIQGLGLVHPSHQWAASVSGARRGRPVFIQEVIYHPPPPEVHQERGECEETAATSADLRPIIDEFAAQAQRLIEGCRRVRMGTSFLSLSIARKFGSLRGKLP